MRKTIAMCVLAASMGSAVPVAAQLDMSAGADLVSNYVWRGFDILDGGPALQPWVGLGLGDTGLSVSAWGSAAVAKRGKLVGGVPRSDLDELDLSLAYSGAAGPLALSAGGIHYSFFGDGYPSDATTTYEVYAGGGLPALPFAPTLTAYYDFNLGDGLYATLSGNQMVSIGRPVELSLAAGYMDQAWRPDAGISDLNVGVGVPFTLGRGSITPAVFFTHSPSSGPLDETNTVWVRLRLAAP